jgi:hypothetical protein
MAGEVTQRELRYRAVSREHFAAASAHAPEIDLAQHRRDAEAVRNDDLEDPYVA